MGIAVDERVISQPTRFTGEFSLPNHLMQKQALRTSVQVQAQEMKKVQYNSDFTFLTKKRMDHD